MPHAHRQEVPRGQCRIWTTPKSHASCRAAQALPDCICMAAAPLPMTVSAACSPATSNTTHKRAVSWLHGYLGLIPTPLQVILWELVTGDKPSRSRSYRALRSASKLGNMLTSSPCVSCCLWMYLLAAGKAAESVVNHHMQAIAPRWPWASKHTQSTHMCRSRAACAH